MLRKLMGIFFFVLAIFALIGVLKNGLVDSIPAVLGALLPIGMFVFSGVFCFTFDRVYNKPYAVGFQIRGRQNGIILVSMVVYFLFSAITILSVGASGSDTFFLDIFIKDWVYFVPFMLFTWMFGYYYLPYAACKKHLVNTPVLVETYLGAGQQYYSFSPDNKVLANQNALFFPRLFCVVPYHQLQSLKHVNQLGEQVVYFNLTNGKKFSISICQYDNIVKAMETYQQFR